MDIYSSDIIFQNIRRIKEKDMNSISNLIAGKLSGGGEFEAIIEDDALCYICNDVIHRRRNVYFIGRDEQAVANALKQVSDKDVFCDYFSRTEDDIFMNLMVESGMTYYSTYIRYTESYNANPYSFHETGRRKILEEMYDPDMAVFPSELDIPELMRINNELFEAYTDDFFSCEDWKRIINNKECLIYKEDGRIIAFYVYRIEGKKLYSNMIASYGPANISYNLERRAFEEAWDKGVRTSYCWIRHDNKKAIKHGTRDKADYVLKTDMLWNFIYRCK